MHFMLRGHVGRQYCVCLNSRESPVLNISIYFTNYVSG